jgi:CRISPR-associated endonuclease Csn1
MNKPYKIGLDIGTGSVGWAVIDENNELVRYKKQNMWGSRLFSNAESAEGRRLNRSNRRRMDRKKRRLSLLRQLFSQAVLAQDEAFFLRMKESMFDQEDKAANGNFLLFNDADFTDADYRKKYPTIYHLRYELIQNPEQKDARLVYLVLHHILKNRGNFLYDKDFNMESMEDINQDLVSLAQVLSDDFGVESEWNFEEIIKILKKQNKSRSAKQKEIMLNIGLAKDTGKEEKDIIANTVKMFVGLKADFAKIFPDDFEKSTTKEFNEKFDEEKSELAAMLGEKFEIIEVCEKIYSWMILQSILKGEKYLSKAMIEKYDQHKKDLALLKKISRGVDVKSRKRFFNGIYEEYIHQPTKIVKRKQNSVPYTVLKSEIEKLLDEVSDDFAREKSEIIKALELGSFLPKMRTSDNGKIPHQVHKAELEKILDNQAKFYPELAANKDKIVKILEFRIPYYVGPLVDAVKTKTPHDFAWMKMKAGENGEILSWNFDQKVDKLASAEEFITRMTNDCTYLFSEPVLPKNSLIFSEYVVRNEINNLRINSYPVTDLVLRDKIFNLFIENKNVTIKKLEDFLRRDNFAGGSPKIEGLADEKKFLGNLAALHDMYRIGIEIDIFNKESANFQMAEDLIRWAVLFGENKEILKAKINEKYGDRLQKDQIEQVANLKYSGWGRLSKKLLYGLKTNFEGEELSILDVLRLKPKNFMQIVSAKEFEFKELIEVSQRENLSGEITYEMVRELAGSPAIKRGIWQSIKIVDEIVDIMGYEPKEVVVEMAREKQVSRRTKSRKKTLEDLMKNIPATEMGEAAAEFKKDFNPYDDRVMLYFLQLGKCAYSGKPLPEIENLSRETQIDHIVPQHLLKDDSFSNRVLVLNEYNQAKSGDLIVPQEYQRAMTPIWRIWLERELMTPAKFARLTRKENQRESLERQFINRQLVETRQITKHVANILNQKFSDDCSVRTIQANLTSSLRNRFNWPKSRELNDFHHAKDAYLAAVMANYLQVRFPEKDREFIYGQYSAYSREQRRQYRDKKTSYEENGVIIGSFLRDFIDKNTGEIIWDSKKNKQIIDRTMRFNDCLVTKKLEENTSDFYKITILPRYDKQAKIPRKKGLLVEKYGGMTGEQMAYSLAIEFDGKKKRERKIVGLPIRFKSNPAEYLAHEYPNYKILRDKIFKNQLIYRDGSPQYLTSYQEVNNAKQLKIPYHFENFIANLAKILSINNIEIGDNKFMILAASRLGFDIEFDYQNPEFSSKQRESVVLEIDAKMDELYSYLVDEKANDITLFSNELKRLRECKEEFVKLDVKQKCETIIRVFKLLHADVSIVDFDHIGWRKTVGQKQIPGGINLSGIELVHQSVTGLKTKKFKL